MAILTKLARATERDSALPALRGSAADAFRTAVSDAFASLGIRATTSGATAVTAEGRTYDVRAIAARCSARRRARWGRLLKEWVRTVADPLDADPRVLLTPERIRSGLVTRLWATDALPKRHTYDYTEPFVPGVVIGYTLDLGDRIVLLDDRMVEYLREIEADPCGLGLDNLARTLFKERVHGQGVDVDQSEFAVLSSSSYFLASHALLLAETLDRVAGVTDLGRGVLFAIPTRHQLLYRVLDADTDDLATLAAMSKTAAREHAGNPAGLSPDVYLWQDGRVTRVLDARALQQVA